MARVGRMGGEPTRRLMPRLWRPHGEVGGSEDLRVVTPRNERMARRSLVAVAVCAECSAYFLADACGRVTD